MTTIDTGIVTNRLPLTFARLREQNVARVERWHADWPEDGWSLADWSNAMAGEMGEAANVVKKLRRQETVGAGSVDPAYEVLLQQLADELADTIVYADLLAAKCGIDLADAITNKFNAISERENMPERLP